MEKSTEIEQNWREAKDFGICFSINFDCHHQYFISGKEIG